MHERTIDVTVPAGVEDGTRIRYQEQGDAGASGAPAGDLYVVLHVKPHPFFERVAGLIDAPSQTGHQLGTGDRDHAVETAGGERASGKIAISAATTA